MKVGVQIFFFSNDCEMFVVKTFGVFSYYTFVILIVIFVV